MTKQDFYIVANFDSGVGVSTICEMSTPCNASNCFMRVKAAYVQWRATLRSGAHSLSIQIAVPRRDDTYRDLLRDVCLLWNVDSELSALDPLHIEVTLSNCGECWIGCSTAVDLADNTAKQGEMRPFEWSDVIKEQGTRQQALLEQEVSRRRTNPVKNPVVLPRRIASEIAEYLRLEFGESARTGVKAGQLKFEGEYLIDGVPTQYWRYPTSNPTKPGWATVERFDGTYSLGMTTIPPPSNHAKDAKEGAT